MPSCCCRWTGEVVREIALSDRGHDIAVDRAARPRRGVFAAAGHFRRRVRDATAGRAQRLAAREDRTFSGHGIFSRDGRLLYATENDTDTGAGLLGIYDDAAGTQRIGEMATHGIDPHEVILLADGAHAGGGQRRHRDERAREAQHRGDGAVAGVSRRGERGAEGAASAAASELNQLSIRHIAADAHGQVWFGGQWEGALHGVAGADRTRRASTGRCG